jgi:alkylated DNA repair dioxygenase AlkB
LVEALVTEYPPGAAIGWHRDARCFGVIVAISLSSRGCAKAPAEERVPRLSSSRAQPIRLAARRDSAGNTASRPPRRPAIRSRSASLARRKPTKVTPSQTNKDRHSVDRLKCGNVRHGHDRYLGRSQTAGYLGNCIESAPSFPLMLKSSFFFLPGFPLLTLSSGL